MSEKSISRSGPNSPVGAMAMRSFSAASVGVLPRAVSTGFDERPAVRKCQTTTSE